ncbi:unnamed protein product [Bursaphelenchus xylophilus]|uniref:Ribonuclease P/MRP protein subunit POP5 n=1 Tax=Bursaphelenchus xylophilus TaxID=6326 RepID=A0A1I7RKX0_BURXY|nr:unnamed protein product [Bursaphelenchus xylophilus]CAG9083766.1 unnamed protein product [Bursaphelenchus xylophilus]
MVKVKHRYLLAEVIYDDPMTRNTATDLDIRNAIMNKVGMLHGDLGHASTQSSLQVKVCDSIFSVVVLRVASDALNYVSSSIPFVVSVGNSDAILRVLFQGSSMRTVEKKLIDFNLKLFYAKLQRKPHGDESNALRTAIARVTGSNVSHIKL